MNQIDWATGRAAKHADHIAAFAGRMRAYLREMYPPAPRLVTASLLYLSFTLLLARIHALQPQLDWIHALVGIWDIWALALILRLMDELKDLDIDRKLFPTRPVPSGRVRTFDIKLSLGGVSIVFLAVHGVLGMAVGSAVALLVYAFLMMRYFYLPPRFKSKLLVNLATHNPIVALMLLHLVILFADQYGIPLHALGWSHVVLVTTMYWGLLLAWELGRKIRYRREESGYQTYSQIFGPLGAVALAVVVQTYSLIVGVHVYAQVGCSVLTLILLLVAYLNLCHHYARFALNRLDTGARLRVKVERFAALVMLAAPADIILGRWVEHALH